MGRSEGHEAAQWATHMAMTLPAPRFLPAFVSGGGRLSLVCWRLHTLTLFMARSSDKRRCSVAASSVGRPVGSALLHLFMGGTG